jgi:peptide/nickel transport system ATP-binding protein
VTLRALMRLLPPKKTRIEGRMTVAGENVQALDAAGLERLRGARVAMIFQEPIPRSTQCSPSARRLPRR